MRVAIITCYKDPDYVRARVLRAALQQLPDIRITIIKNSQKGLGRYWEVLQKIRYVKKQEQPEVFLLTFRGYELLPFLLRIAGQTPVIFDEFINLTEWVVDEHRKVKPNSLAAKIINGWYRRQLQKCLFILADTPAHAEYSAKRSDIPLEKYMAIPVGTDERVFTPQLPHPTKDFQIFYYGSMLPLHGLEIVLQAAEQLKNSSKISFLLVGGGPATATKITAAKQNGAHIEYKNWVEFEQLPQIIAESALCLAGPFGNTVQAQLVVTGKAYQFLASGAPTVIGRNSASADFVNKDNALMVPQGNATALAETIAWAATHPTQLQKIGQNGRKLFEQKFSTKIIAAKLQTMLDQLSSALGRASLTQSQKAAAEKQRSRRDR